MDVCQSSFRPEGAFSMNRRPSGMKSQNCLASSVLLDARAPGKSHLDKYPINESLYSDSGHIVWIKSENSKKFREGKLSNLLTMKMIYWLFPSSPPCRAPLDLVWKYRYSSQHWSISAGCLCWTRIESSPILISRNMIVLHCLNSSYTPGQIH